MGNTKRRKDRKRQEVLENDSLSMECFLTRYLGVTDYSIVQANLTHKDLKDMFPNLKRTGFAQVLDDPALVKTGEVILVTDSAHITVPYINKGFKLDMSDVMDSEEWNEPETWTKKDNTPDIHDYELKSLTTYELACLLGIYAKSNQRFAYEVVRRELVSRSDSIHASRQSKAKALRKELKRNKNRKEEDEF